MRKNNENNVNIEFHNKVTIILNSYEVKQHIVIILRLLIEYTHIIYLIIEYTHDYSHII